jgi:hypothetical protein
MLTAYVPYLEIYWRVWRWKLDCSDILADGRYGLQVGVGGRVCSFYLLEERGFTSIVKAKEEDGVFWVALAVAAYCKVYRKDGSTFFAGGVEVY